MNDDYRSLYICSTRRYENSHYVELTAAIFASWRERGLCSGRKFNSNWEAKLDHIGFLDNASLPRKEHCIVAHGSRRFDH